MIYLTLAIEEDEFNERLADEIEGKVGPPSSWPVTATAHGIVRDYGVAASMLERR